jgi:hypothetical protein
MGKGKGSREPSSMEQQVPPHFDDLDLLERGEARECVSKEKLA